MTTRTITAHQAIQYLIDRRHGSAYEVRAYNLSTEDPLNHWTVVTERDLNDFLVSWAFDWTGWCGIGPFQLWYRDEPGPPQELTKHEAWVIIRRRIDEAAIDGDLLPLGYDYLLDLALSKVGISTGTTKPRTGVTWAATAATAASPPPGATCEE